MRGRVHQLLFLTSIGRRHSYIKATIMSNTILELRAMENTFIDRIIVVTMPHHNRNYKGTKNIWDSPIFVKQSWDFHPFEDSYEDPIAPNECTPVLLLWKEPAPSCQYLNIIVRIFRLGRRSLFRLLLLLLPSRFILLAPFLLLLTRRRICAFLTVGCLNLGLDFGLGFFPFLLY